MKTEILQNCTIIVFIVILVMRILVSLNKEKKLKFKIGFTIIYIFSFTLIWILLIWQNEPIKQKTLWLGIYSFIVAGTINILIYYIQHHIQLYIKNKSRKSKKSWKT